MAGGAVSWSARKQPTVTWSSGEAEYMALGVEQIADGLTKALSREKFLIFRDYLRMKHAIGPPLDEGEE